jgi:hypothetical protein
VPNIPRSMTEVVRHDLERHNDNFRAFDRYRPRMRNSHLELADPGPEREILWHWSTAAMRLRPRRAWCIFQRSRYTIPSRIPILNCLYGPLQYPLLYPLGTRGWGDSMGCNWTQDQYKEILFNYTRFHTFSRLGSEWIYDLFSRIEDEHLGKNPEIAECNDRR